MDYVLSTKLKHLEILQDRMKFVSSESNSYANKYLLGGTITVIALLNMDLVMAKRIISNSPVFNLIFLLLVIVIAVLYFYIVAKHIERFNQAYRKTKYKYEILLYDLLEKDHEIINKFETDLFEKFKKKKEFTFEDLRKHHLLKYKKISWKGIMSLPLLIVLLTLVIKIFYIIT
ncbi:hypothetical protein [Aquimarina sp. AU474]|uniref:hypothetical protein n=1 Tax=Aquimarina sp. AU474 TaxID=2108529 RepID=UPI000D6899CA|nr:hypothetical protein [Aquimarina sp. AU474]